MSLKDEAEEFDDILQFDFRDSYQNLTTKVVTMIGWASQLGPMFVVSIFVLPCKSLDSKNCFMAL